VKKSATVDDTRVRWHKAMLRARDAADARGLVPNPPTGRRYFIVGIEKSARTAEGSGQRCVTVLRRV
jgi:hypothetical protein